MRPKAFERSARPSALRSSSASVIALVLARTAGAGWTRAFVEAVIVFAIGVAVIETKAALSH
jgi:hypothetical protein